MMKSTDDVKIYFVTIPAHKFLHIKNYESNGYWDFGKTERDPGAGLRDDLRACSTA